MKWSAGQLLHWVRASLNSSALPFLIRCSVPLCEQPSVAPTAPWLNPCLWWNSFSARSRKYIVVWIYTVSLLLQFNLAHSQKLFFVSSFTSAFSDDFFFPPCCMSKNLECCVGTCCNQCLAFSANVLFHSCSGVSSWAAHTSGRGISLAGSCFHQEWRSCCPYQLSHGNLFVELVLNLARRDQLQH